MTAANTGDISDSSLGPSSLEGLSAPALVGHDGRIDARGRVA